jgi:lysophospholipase L1-like esterase
MFAATRKTTGTLILGGGAAVFTLLLLELAVRVAYPQPINYYNFTLIQADGGGEMVSSSSSISSFRSRGSGRGPYKPNLATQFGGTRVTTNSYGWRDVDYALEKPVGITRVMVVGDSVTFGYGVELDDMFTRVLERELNRQGGSRYQVLSLGGAGAHTYSQRNIIKENVPVYRPDIVILAFHMNDILPKVAGRKSVSSPSARRLMARIFLDARRTLDTSFRSHSHLYFLFRERMKILLRQFGIVTPAVAPLGAFDIESDYGVAAWRETGEALLEIATYLEENGIRFLLAILPVEMQISQQIADIYRHEYKFTFADSLVHGKPQEIITEFTKQHGIVSVDLLPAFREAPEEQKFFRIYGATIDWAHPNSLGHRIIGEELQKYLRSHRILESLPVNGRKVIGSTLERAVSSPDPS